MRSFGEYFYQVQVAMVNIDPESLQRALASIDTCDRLFIMGNGGSAAIADHWVCDYMKGINEDTRVSPPAKAISLVSNGPLVTALANDCGYENIFTKQLQYYDVGRRGDVVLAVSSSGNSKNVVNALQYAKSKDVLTVALTGFTGGDASAIADVCVHVPSSNYGVVEDCHMMVLHAISQQIRYRDAIDREFVKL